MARNHGAGIISILAASFAMIYRNKNKVVENVLAIWLRLLYNRATRHRSIKAGRRGLPSYAPLCRRSDLPHSKKLAPCPF